MKNFICKKCGNTTYIVKEKSNGTGLATGLYCAQCGFWHKWLNKQEKVLYSSPSAEIDKDKEIARLTAENERLKEIKDECDLYKKFADGGAIDLVIESGGRLREIEKLKQQLAEKDTRIEELEGQFAYECECNKQLVELQKQLDQANERLKGLPKFKNGDFVWAIFTDDGIYKCQIDAFDYFTNTYLVFPNEDIGNEWIVASYIFKTKKEAEKKLQELRVGEYGVNLEDEE